MQVPRCSQCRVGRNDPFREMLVRLLNHFSPIDYKHHGSGSILYHPECCERGIRRFQPARALGCLWRILQPRWVQHERPSRLLERFPRFFHKIRETLLTLRTRNRNACYSGVREQRDEVALSNSVKRLADFSGSKRIRKMHSATDLNQILFV